MNQERPMPIYNAIHGTYDNIMVVQKPAERLVIHTKLAPGQRVLDVACGTGWATVAAARAVGNTGSVIGIDIADKMLDIAREKTSSIGLSNVEYRIGDAESLEFDDASFDAVICASSIFIFRNIPRALGEWYRVLKAGGRIAFSSFGVGFFQPVHGMFGECLARYLGQEDALVNEALQKADTSDKCRKLLENFAFDNVDITTEQLGFYFKDTNAYWEEMDSGITGLFMARLSPADLGKFKAEHLKEIKSLCTERGIWIDIPAIFTVATKR